MWVGFSETMTIMERGGSFITTGTGIIMGTQWFSYCLPIIIAIFQITRWVLSHCALETCVLISCLPEKDRQTVCQGPAATRVYEDCLSD